MGKQEFNIGDAVYTIHIGDTSGIYLKHQLVVGVDTRIEVRFHSAQLPSDLGKNITRYIYKVMKIYTNDDGSFSLNACDTSDESIEGDRIFENQDDARAYLFDEIKNIKVE